jgi:hypothetical protein
MIKKQKKDVAVNSRVRIRQKRNFNVILTRIEDACTMMTSNVTATVHEHEEYLSKNAKQIESSLFTIKERLKEAAISPKLNSFTMLYLDISNPYSKTAVQVKDDLDCLRLRRPYKSCQRRHHLYHLLEWPH